MNRKLIKCYCIKDRQGADGYRKGEIYLLEEWVALYRVYNLDKSTQYNIISIDTFRKHFIDIATYRNKQINKILK